MDFTQTMVSMALGIPKNHIDMSVRRLGGGYGGKATPAFFIACATAVAAWKVNKPVRFVMDLKSCMSFIGKRENYLVKYKAGADANNKLQYVDCDMFVDCGWNPSESMGIAEAIPFSQGAYNSTSWNMNPFGVITDHARETAVR